jgi:hypothetical protein
MRPLEGYLEQGIAANFAGKPKERCPYRRGTVAELDWTIGWLEASLETPDISWELDGRFDTVSEFRNETAIVIENLKWDRDNLCRQARRILPELSVFEALCGPVEQWKFNCYGISKRIFESGLLAPLAERFGEAKLCYGVYDGEIPPEGHYGKREFARHGWIEFDSGLVVDPTLWVFKGTEPEVACTGIDGYDLAGARLNKRFLYDRPPPAFDATQRVFRWDSNDEDLTALADSLLKKGSRIASHGEFSLGQAFWIANTPVEVLGDNASAFYRVLERAGLLGIVPLDNREFVDGPLGRDEEP